jgi:hypothetical protein
MKSGGDEHPLNEWMNEWMISFNKIIKRFINLLNNKQ